MMTDHYVIIRADRGQMFVDVRCMGMEEAPCRQREAEEGHLKPGDCYVTRMVDVQGIEALELLFSGDLVRVPVYADVSDSRVTLTPANPPTSKSEMFKPKGRTSTDSQKKAKQTLNEV